MNYKVLLFIIAFLLSSQFAIGQQDNSNIYVDSLGQVYVKANVPAYLFISPNSNSDERILIPSNDPRTNPMVFDGNGIHYLQTQDATTQKSITFKIVADGIAPKVSIHFKKGLLMSSGKRYYVDEGSVAEFVAKDNYSGAKSVFVSIDGSTFSDSKTVLFDKGSDYRVKAFAIDNVGNISDTMELTAVITLN